MTDRPKKPFTLAHDDTTPASPDQSIRCETIRDKDNAQTRPPPPKQVRLPHPRLAPGGALGIKRNLPAPDHRQAAESKPKAPGDLSRAFKPLATGKSKDRGHDR